MVAFWPLASSATPKSTLAPCEPTAPEMRWYASEMSAQHASRVRCQYWADTLQREQASRAGQDMQASTSESKRRCSGRVQ